MATCKRFNLMYQLLLTLQLLTLVASQLQQHGYARSVKNDANCPPGMVYKNPANEDGTAFSGACQCGNTPSPDSKTDHLYNLYDGISYCLQTSNGSRAYIKNSYWAGYYENSTENAAAACHSADDLIVMLCPELFCDLDWKNPKAHAKQIYPGFDADEVFCASRHRTGLLCSHCAEGFGDAINSLGNICTNCSGGPSAAVAVFVWVLTEIVPEVLLVIVFVIVDVPLLAGHMNAFLLFAHTSRAMNLYANRVLDVTSSDSNPTESLSYWIDWIYSLWSLNFLGSAPFFPPLCVSREFTLLNKLSIQYVVAFLPFPIILSVYALRLCYRREPSRLCWGCIFRIMQKVHTCVARIQHAFGKSSSSVRNGFASFLLLVYSKVCFVSFYILATETLSESCIVVYLDPYLRPFHQEHLGPALLACFSIAFFIVCPIVVLLFYKPIHDRYKKRVAITLASAEGQPKIKYSRQTEMFFKFLDTFTEGFQSKYTFFGGVLFLYRAIMWICFANIPTPQLQYVVQMIVTAILLMIHLVCMPYKRKVNWLNKFDAVMYTNIILINGMSLYNFFLISNNYDESILVFVLQQFCIMLPMLYPIVALCVLLAKLLKKKSQTSNSASTVGKDMYKVTYGTIGDDSISVSKLVDESQEYLHTNGEESSFLLSESPLRFDRSELLSVSVSSINYAGSKCMCSCCDASVGLCCFNRKRSQYDCKTCAEDRGTAVDGGVQPGQTNSADSQQNEVIEVEVYADSSNYPT